MHALEHLLNILVDRIRETGNEELANDAAKLIGVSYHYAPIDDENAGGELNDEWSRLYLPPVEPYPSLYVIEANPGFFKIGYAKYPERRLRNLQCGNHQPLSIVHIEHGEDDDEAKRWEGKIHDLLRSHRCRFNGEWFECSLDQIREAISQAKGSPARQHIR
jgi:predicted GIY-YIG superfamily endonuclease